MATPSVLNLQKMLEPIAGDSMVGPDLRLDISPGSIYQQIRDAREQSRNVEREIQKGNPDYSPDQLVWNKVQELSTKALTEKSKDFGITAWLCEALVRLKGFGGLRDGLKFARKLADDYWSGLYPQPEEEEGVEPPSDLEKVITRVKPFEGLFAGALAFPINNIVITESEPYSFADYRAAQALDKESDKAVRQAKLDAGVVQMGEFNAAHAATTPEFYKNLHEDLMQCLAELQNLSKSLDNKCGKDEKGFPVSPPVSDTEKLLGECLEIVVNLGKSKGLFAAEAAGGTDVATTGEAGAAQGQPAANGRGSIVTRDDALAALSHIAEFFRRVEPHSPIAHHVEEAVRWGRMDLATLLSELIGDDKMRQAVFTRIGIMDVAEAKKK
ncbi:MAG: type VI secretion system protein TssA [Pirellulales bacterium]